MPLSDIQIAQALERLYAGGGWSTFYEPGIGDNGVCWAHLVGPDENYLLFRGSKTPEDWYRDFLALAPFQHQAFGRVHPGFLEGMSLAIKEFSQYWDKAKPLCITGHSLGAARAHIAAALLLTEGAPPSTLRLVTFGSPKPGMQQFSDFLSGVGQRSYRTASPDGEVDKVTEVPPTLVGEWYVHPKPLINVAVPNQPSGLFSLHHLPLYISGLTS